MLDYQPVSFRVDIADDMIEIWSCYPDVEFLVCGGSLPLLDDFILKFVLLEYEQPPIHCDEGNHCINGGLLDGALDPLALDEIKGCCVNAWETLIVDEERITGIRQKGAYFWKIDVVHIFEKQEGCCGLVVFRVYEVVTMLHVQPSRSMDEVILGV